MAIAKHIKEHAILGVEDSTYNDTRYVNTTGDTMTGDLNFPATGFVMTDTVTSGRYRVVLTSEALVITPIITTPIGSPWLFLFGNI